MPLHSLSCRFAVEVKGLSHTYGSRQAIVDLSLEIAPGELFAILGPNGSGKTTLFRLLSTLIPVQRGDAAVFGTSLAAAAAVREQIGVVFQAPSLDRKLTVAENIALQGVLYGLRGRELRTRIDGMLDQFHLRDRANELTERLSGGLRRRVELAKGLIHRPRLLILDEPSAGLDPGARGDLRHTLRQLKESEGTTIILTTHYMDEAESSDRLAIMNAGRLVALGTPRELRETMSGDSLIIETAEPDSIAREIHDRFNLSATLIDQSLRMECFNGHALVPRLMEAFPGRITAIRVGKPTLDDVFIARTGHRFWRDRQAETT